MWNGSNLVKFIDVFYDTGITFPQNGYIDIVNDIDALKNTYNTLVAPKNIIIAELLNWEGNNAPYGVNAKGNYIMGNPGITLKSFIIRYLYK